MLKNCSSAEALPSACLDTRTSFAVREKKEKRDISNIASGTMTMQVQLMNWVSLWDRVILASTNSIWHNDDASTIDELGIVMGSCNLGINK